MNRPSPTGLPFSGAVLAVKGRILGAYLRYLDLQGPARSWASRHPDLAERFGLSGARASKGPSSHE